METLGCTWKRVASSSSAMRQVLSVCQLTRKFGLFFYNREGPMLHPTGGICQPAAANLRASSGSVRAESLAASTEGRFNAIVRMISVSSALGASVKTPLTCEVPLISHQEDKHHGVENSIPQVKFFGFSFENYAPVRP